jgi:hypothetical protein
LELLRLSNINYYLERPIVDFTTLLLFVLSLCLLSRCPSCLPFISGFCFSLLFTKDLLLLSIHSTLEKKVFPQQKILFFTFHDIYLFISFSFFFSLPRAAIHSLFFAHRSKHNTWLSEHLDSELSSVSSSSVFIIIRHLPPCPPHPKLKKFFIKLVSY